MRAPRPMSAGVDNLVMCYTQRGWIGTYVAQHLLRVTLVQ